MILILNGICQAFELMTLFKSLSARWTLLILKWFLNIK